MWNDIMYHYNMFLLCNLHDALRLIFKMEFNCKDSNGTFVVMCVPLRSPLVRMKLKLIRKVQDTVQGGVCAS